MTINSACNNGNPIPPREWTRGSVGWPCNSSNINYSDLDMRRKAQILEYNANMNKITKKERWSKIAKGNWTSKKAYASQVIGVETNPNTMNLPRTGDVLLCPNKNLFKFYPSSSSDVPGNTMLRFDNRVPLYNYRQQRVWNAGANKWPYLGPRVGGPRLNYFRPLVNHSA